MFDPLVPQIVGRILTALQGSSRSREGDYVRLHAILQKTVLESHNIVP
ncbi:hypothetical protein DSOL_4684 [Desulfosporosinus metallidurans]|uniref:Uncharacterized protein n=1 Tax=Desulfosporosinus metallidurans TaxID=1888891 RepID=A0A1Q8QIP0_9FIRM|nr:hypothetical protein DSOL_4684 [Desulfosporosinus metallidurans]